MHKREPALSKGGGTTKLSETLKIQAVGAGFLAKSNLCSSEAELVGGIDRRKLTKKQLYAGQSPQSRRAAVPAPLTNGSLPSVHQLSFCRIQMIMRSTVE